MGALGELPDGHGDAGVVALALGGDAAGAGHEEAVLQGFVEGGYDPGAVEDEGSVLRPAVRVVVEVAGGVDQDQVPESEVGHRAGHSAYVTWELRSHEDDPEICHASRIAV